LIKHTVASGLRLFLTRKLSEKYTLYPFRQYPYIIQFEEYIRPQGWGASVNSVADVLQCKVYPNPVQNLLTIEQNSIIQMIEVYDLSGQKVIQLYPKVKAISFNIDHLNKGVYIVKIDNSFAKFMKK